MDVGGQAADQLARTSIQLTEESIKLLASGSKNLTAFLLALAKDNKKLVGRTNLKRLLQEDKASVIYHVKAEDWKTFGRYAKEYGVLYAGVRSKSNDNGIIDVISNVGYVPKLNRVMELMNYPIPSGKEAQTAKKAEARAPQKRCSPERGSGSTPSTQTSTNDKPSVKGRLAALEAASRDMKQPPQREQTKTR